MLDNFTKLAVPRKAKESVAGSDDEEDEAPPVAPFQVFYEYINKIGGSIEVLRIPSMDKTKLKSNHFWIMPLLTKLPALRVIKMHKHPVHSVG